MNVILLNGSAVFYSNGQTLFYDINAAVLGCVL